MDPETVRPTNGNGNGHGDPEAAKRAARQAAEQVAGREAEEMPSPRAAVALGALGALGSLVKSPGRAVGSVARLARTRVPPADLDERDPDYIRESLPGLWLLASLYFRAEVRGLGNIP